MPYDATPGATLSSRLASALADIQYGRAPHAWSLPVGDSDKF